MAATTPPSIVVSECRSQGHIDMDTPLPSFSIYKRWKTMTSLRQASTPINVYCRSTSVDVEANFGGGSPSRTSDSPRSGTSVPKTRFLEGFRRRRLHSECQTRTRTSLDEDLGYPPVCSPPPEPYFLGAGAGPARSAPDSSHLRIRHHSTGDGFAPGSPSGILLQKRQSGILVVFPNTPASSPITGGEFFASPSKSPSIKSFDEASVMTAFDSDTDDQAPSALPTKGFLHKFRKRLLSSDGKLSPHSSRENVATRPSPRRPLFVDTQLANEKRSPMGSVVDFVRGRSRTSSLSCSVSSPNTPCSPQSVSARASASADMPMSPLFSPGGRPLLGKQFRSGYKSLDSDSGLGLSSPSIGTTALLIKERALFHSFDSMTLGSSVGDCNTVFFDCHDAVYSLFMRAHKCYDLIPTSSKLVVFDTHLPVRKAFFALVYNGVRAAPLWDSDKQRFVGMLTITDFIKILIKHYEAGDSSEKMRALEEEEISHWRQQFAQDGCLRSMVAIDPNESLYRAVQVLCESKVHRLPVLDSATGNISYILTHKRIIKYLSIYMYDLPRPSYMEKTPQELGIGSWGDILTIHVDTPLHDALEIFLKNRVSALPLVDEEGKVVDIYAKFDVISLAAEKSYDKLDCTVQEALSHRSEWFEGVRTCRETDSLFSVLENIVKAEVHRLIVIDENRKVVGIIALSDILKYLVLDPVIVASQPPSVCGEDSPIDGIPEANED